MRIWKKPISLELISQSMRHTAMEHIGLEVVEIGDDFLAGRLPVDTRTHQPYGLLHGGMSVVLAETLGSMGGFYACEPGYQALGLDINANHIRSVRDGWVKGVARPLHMGRTTHVWQIDIHSDKDQLVCVSRITLMIGPSAKP